MIRLTAIIAMLCLFIISSGVESIGNVGRVLAVDTDHDGVVNQNTIKEGRDFILVKQNPTTLDADAITFITNKDSIVTSAVYDDLDKPTAFKQVFIASYSYWNA